MIERHSDLWEMHRVPGHLVCISTNGFVKRNGCAVMGAGCAKQATQIHLGIAKQFGDYLKKNGNAPGVLEGHGWRLGVLPVKHNWWERADLGLIKSSIDWLNATFDDIAGGTILHVPRLGCGNGGRDWETEVRPLMAELGNNVIVHG